MQCNRDETGENSIECFLVTVNKVYIYLFPVHKRSHENIQNGDFIH